MKKKVIVIGAGFSGISTACFLAKAGFDVTVLEKHSIPGGRARQFSENGFTFDMGPSWYWMPDVFERYFQQFGKSVTDYYTLSRLDPSYKIYWENSEMEIPAAYNELRSLFETIEKGAAIQLDAFLKEAEFKYKVGINKLVHKPGLSLLEFIDADLIKGVFKLDVFQSIKKHISKFFRHPHLQQLLEFPVLFLGAMPSDTPALYSLMNYADIVGGTWFPNGGMHSIVKGMHSLALELGVTFYFNQEITSISIDSLASANQVISKQMLSGESTSQTQAFSADAIVGSADYHHIETELLPHSYRSYSDKYWDTRVMAPSSLLYYVGINKKLHNVQHHTLFFDTSFEIHGNEIYNTKEWPSNPLFYMNIPSVTDASVAPVGCENLFFLIPVAVGLNNDTEAIRTHYFNNIIERVEKRIGQNIKDHIIYKRSYSHSNFISDYHSFKGNAYGLANTLLQTAVLKPSCKSKKVKNLFYTGQLTVPGPGVPPAIISGEVVAKEVSNFLIK